MSAELSESARDFIEDTQELISEAEKGLEMLRHKQYRRGIDLLYRFAHGLKGNMSAMRETKLASYFSDLCLFLKITKNTPGRLEDFIGTFETLVTLCQTHLLSYQLQAFSESDQAQKVIDKIRDHLRAD